ncbi:MAG: hypothetical protein EZS28_005632 [Streblomastix strix]|uniref:Uncharacterized protein n=1 Tax=Streblomastix strix TaxID=222440 RepID=A0A5J4WVB4_9EUKA|nr:MAG: hypothetical protein EZS28_005632 [Streblomastix strix]
MDPLVAQQSLFEKNKRKRVDMISVVQALMYNIVEQQAPIFSQGVCLQGTAGIMSLSQQFDVKFKENAKFNLREEDAVAKNFEQMMEGICNSEMRKFDPKAIVVHLMEKQILFQKIQRKLANRLWMVPFVALPTNGEEMLMYRNALESTAIIWHVFLDLMFQLRLGKPEGFMKKLIA